MPPLNATQAADNPLLDVVVCLTPASTCCESAICSSSLCSLWLALVVVLCMKLLYGWCWQHHLVLAPPLKLLHVAATPACLLAVAWLAQAVGVCCTLNSAYLELHMILPYLRSSQVYQPQVYAIQCLLIVL
jgi:hypothetical protein